MNRPDFKLGWNAAREAAAKQCETDAADVDVSQPFTDWRGVVNTLKGTAGRIRRLEPGEPQ